jgi:two-component system sensor histidine kinase RegB
MALLPAASRWQEQGALHGRSAAGDRRDEIRYNRTMSDLAFSDFRHPRRYVLLDTILRLRWLTALGQFVAIIVVVKGLEFDLPVVPCMVIISCSALLNLGLQLIFSPMYRLTPAAAAALLALNIVELAALLYFTGGLENPFSFLFLAPVLISATALPTRFTIGLAMTTAALATLVGFYHLPLPWELGNPLVLPQIYLVGVWISIVVAIGVTSLYAFQVTEESRKLADALAATELVLTREQHLTQLDGLAAAAAHELGTPLSTIFLISRELEGSLAPDSPIASDVKTLREQAQRCREILAKITQLSSSGAPFDRMPLSTLIEEVVAPHREFGVAINIQIVSGGNGSPEPVGIRNPAILHGIGNIVENAVDFAREAVDVSAWWNDEFVELVISDDGPGIAPEILKRIGEPYISRRRHTEDRGSRAGLGLGVFIARTLLERAGAEVSFRNRVFPGHGAVVRIVWPRTSFESSDVTPANS